MGGEALHERVWEGLTPLFLALEPIPTTQRRLYFYVGKQIALTEIQTGNPLKKMGFPGREFEDHHIRALTYGTDSSLIVI